jgi:hypothetical protein
MVVPVLMISCQVLLKPKRGPEKSQMTITSAASVTAMGCPAARAVALAKRLNHDDDVVRFTESDYYNPSLNQLSRLDAPWLRRRSVKPYHYPSCDYRALTPERCLALLCPRRFNCRSILSLTLKGRLKQATNKVAARKKTNPVAKALTNISVWGRKVV